MLNLLSSSPSKTAGAVVDSTAPGGDSPLAARAGGTTGDGSGEVRATPAGRAFAGLFAAALAEGGKARTAPGTGNGLPVPALQVSEIGAGMQLLTPAGTDLPREDALFAFAVSQGLDAALVASILWPAAGAQDPGQLIDGTAIKDRLIEGTVGDAAAAVAALLAGVATGQVTVADGAKAGASLINGLASSGEGAGKAAGSDTARLSVAAEALLGDTTTSAVAGAWAAASQLAAAPAVAAQALAGAGSGADNAAPGRAAGSGIRPDVGGMTWLASELYKVLPPAGSVAGAAGSASTAASGSASANHAGGVTGSPVPGSSAGSAPGLDFRALLSGLPGEGAKVGQEGAQPDGTARVPASTSVGSGASGTAATAAASISVEPLPAGQTSPFGGDRSAIAQAGRIFAAGFGENAGASPQNPDGQAGSVARDSAAVLGRHAAIDPALSGGSILRGAEGAMARALAAVPAQWVLGTGAERSGGAQGGAQGPALREDDPDASFGEALGEVGLDHAAVGHHRAAAPPRDGVFRDMLDLTQDLADAARDRSEDSELAKLSRKVSDGIAQRMVTSLANDNWKVRLDLKPAHLGQVSVDMTVVQGQIEAVFDASNPAARALIADGLDRLRQDLQRSGMNVAFLSMNSGSGGGHAGKSTSQQRDDTVKQSGKTEIERVQAGPMTNRIKTVDGLDVLV
ncbi:MAG: flagellar hook-length control protein FliK [Betaproteobacteria bacterium]